MTHVVKAQKTQPKKNTENIRDNLENNETSKLVIINGPNTLKIIPEHKVLNRVPTINDQEYG